MFLHSISSFPRLHRTSIAKLKNTLNFVKIIPTKNHNFDLALRKRLFCVAKPTLLPCKTAAFGMQNNRFCKTLTARWLRNTYACEKYLHFYRLISLYIIRCKEEAGQKSKMCFGGIVYKKKIDCLTTTNLQNLNNLIP